MADQSTLLKDKEKVVLNMNNSVVFHAENPETSLFSPLKIDQKSFFEVF